MSTKNLLVLSITFLLALTSINVKAQNQTPNGTEENPYPIESAAALNALRDCMNGNGNFYYDANNHTFTTTQPTGASPISRNHQTHYKLMSDIDLNPEVNVAACDGNATGLTEWVPFVDFYGQLDGDFHIISGLFINKPTVDQVGFIKALTVNNVIKNLGIVNAYISGKKEVGGLAGNMGACIIVHCFVDAVIEAAAEEVGGIVGKASYTQIDTCYVTGSISSYQTHLGGICGNGTGMTLRGCYSSAVINYPKNELVGGIAGELKQTAVINGCYYDKQMCGATTTAGTGMMTENMLDGTWSGLGVNFVYNDNYYPLLKNFDASNEYVKLSTVPILLGSEQTMDSLYKNFKVGGGANVSWVGTDTNYAERFGSDSVRVYQEGWLQLIATLNGKTHTVAFYTNKAPFIGTEANPFPINNFADLIVFREGVNSATDFPYRHFMVKPRAIGTWFRQTCDISLASVDNWQKENRIGISDLIAFEGGYDGGGHKVTDLKATISTGDAAKYTGFFGYIKNGHIKNLGVRVSKFEPNECSGPLCGQVMGKSTIDSCYSELDSTSGSLVLRTKSSGLIGKTSGMKGTISNCTNNCNIVSSTLSYVGLVGGVIGDNETIDSLVIRDCLNAGNITGSIDKVGGVVCQLDGTSTAKAWVIRCKNTGNISIEYIWAEIGGVLGRKINSVNVTMSHCYNAGNITSSYSAAGIVCSAVNSLSFCVNTGDIWVKEKGQIRASSAFGIARGADVYSSLNAGKVTVDYGGDAYGITNCGAFDCINAGELTAHSENWRPYPLTGWNSNYGSSKRNINIGRVNGVQSYWGVTKSGQEGYNFSDEQVVFDAHTAANYITKKKTEDMLGNGLKTQLGEANWVFADGMYPRIKGLDTLPISIVTATPVIFGDGQTINSVSSNFHVGCATPGVVWKYNGDTVTTNCSGNKKVVNVGDNVIGMKYLTVTYHGVTKTVRFCRKVNAPADTLKVEGVDDLRVLRDGVNSGAPFVYKNKNVPARAEKTKFKQTTNITMTSSDANWMPIGKVDAQFNGEYDGNSKTISNLQQHNVLNGGLFGYGYYAKIHDLTMVNVKITEVRGCGGAVIAVSDYDNITNCSASGEISSYSVGKIGNNEKGFEDNVGGIVGNVYCSVVRSCVNYCKVRGYAMSNIGGIMGRGYYTKTGYVDSCANYGIITGDYCVGGLVGHSQPIYNSYNAGEVSGTESAVFVGGLAGHAAWVSNSFNTGKVRVVTSDRESYVGGLVGQIRNATAALITGCYNAGIVEANRMYVGGIFGGSIQKDEWNGTNTNNRITVQYNYVSNAVESRGKYVGAIGGYNIVDPSNSQISYNYYDTTFCYVKGINGKNVAGRAEGKGTRQMVGNRMQSLLGANFAYSDTNYYPLVKGNVATWPASLASAANCNCAKVNWPRVWIPILSLEVVLMR